MFAFVFSNEVWEYSGVKQLISSVILYINFTF